MLIILPPSETKSTGGAGAPLNFGALSFPSLNPVREAIANDLVALCSGDEAAAREVLGLGPKLAGEVAANEALLSSPTSPAIERYTGVLYDALAASDLTPGARGRLAVGSALFGLVGAEDPIPHYRLSGTVKLPDGGAKPPTMRVRWGSAITDALMEADDFILDLRSGAYRTLGKAPGAVVARVETPDGKVVSHFNKRHKGLLARALAEAADVGDIEQAVDVARAAGLDARVDEAAGEPQVTVTVAG